MEYVQAQFSLKFEPQIRIRRYANQIAHLRQCLYQMNLQQKHLGLL